MDISPGSDRSETVNIQVFSIYGPEFVEFFDIEMLEGRNIFEGEKEACLINKTASLLLNSHDSSAVKRIFNLPVVGVIADMYIDSPLMPVFPSIYKITTPQPWRNHSEDSKHYVYRYVEGQREATEKEIKRLATDEFGIQNVNIMSMEEIYAEYTRSERYLLILLSVMTGVAILIAVFGAYSIITLTCRRRRKEIAIRKVNGATVTEIMRLFLREYLLITLVACMVSFPAGVLVMQRWLEQYTRRVSMEWWLFAALFLLMVLLVLASVLFQVVRAARENPSEVVKSE
jgi:ABC-type antimicrobial peptide transport system permease subunit